MIGVNLLVKGVGVGVGGRASFFVVVAWMTCVDAFCLLYLTSLNHVIII